MPRNNLDFLRAVAVLSVFGAHCSMVILQHNTDLEWHFGQLGVLIFFVHTSLVLMLSLERMNDAHLVRRFYIRRAARIYPLAIVCVLISFLLCRTGVTFEGFTWRELAGNLTLTQNLFYQRDMVAGLWTLPLEVQMYIALPFCFLALRRKSFWWAIGFWTLSVPIALLQIHTSARLATLGYAPCFVGGIIAWRMLRTTRNYKLPASLWPIGICAAATVWMFSDRIHDMWFRWSLGIVLGCIVSLFRELKANWVVKPAQVVAQYSYGIYLTHASLLHIWFHGIHVSRSLQVAGFIASAVLAPVVLYHVVEEPLIEWGRSITEGRIRPDVAIVKVPLASESAAVASGR